MMHDSCRANLESYRNKINWLFLFQFATAYTSCCLTTIATTNHNNQKHVLEANLTVLKFYAIFRGMTKTYPCSPQKHRRVKLNSAWI